MAEVTQRLLTNAINARYSSLKNTLTEENVSSVWENVAAYVEKQMTQMKGVQIPGLGVFSISQKKIEVGSNRFVITQRPVFNVSEKFAQIHNLQFQKYHVPGSVKVLQLNMASISYETPFDRDTVERCVKEIIRSTSLAVAAKKNVELCFTGIGQLIIREGRIKMKFFKEFINEFDSTGKLVDSLMKRTGTADSVMSHHSQVRPYSSNTVILPRLFSNHDRTNASNNYNKLTPVAEEEPSEQQQLTSKETHHPLSHYSEVEITQGKPDYLEISYRTEPAIDAATENIVENIMREENMFDTKRLSIMDSENNEEFYNNEGSKPVSKMILPISKANGINLTDEIVRPSSAQKICKLAELRRTHNDELSTGLKPPTPPKLSFCEISRRSDGQANEQATKLKVLPPPQSACGHSSAGQELCYLCHQRAKRNVPVFFTEELKRRDEEEDKLLKQFQAMKDAEETLKDHERNCTRLRDLQKISAFNLGIAEALQDKKKLKESEPQCAYIFQRRPLTPCRLSKQEKYLQDLNNQVNYKEDVRQKKKADEEFLERVEQMQLAEDSAAQREQYLRHKAESTEAYKKALNAQLMTKPAVLPDREPDGEIFGKNDMTTEKMAERRHKAQSIFQKQQSLVEHRKRDAVLARLAEQQHEEEVLKKAKDDMNDERAFNHMVRYESRKHHEKDWQKVVQIKKARELEDQLWLQSPGILMHEQCDRYKRCHQCRRQLHNCGESNLWRESRYIPGSRIML